MAQRSLAVLAAAFALLILSCSQDPAPITLHGVSEGAGSAGVHTVMPGDTLYSVSERYNIPLRDIAMVNRVPAPFALTVGQRLRLPPPQDYRVRRFDSLYTISRLFNVSTSEIARLNHLAPPYRLHENQVIKLPSVSRLSQARRPPPVSPGFPESASAAPVPGVVRTPISIATPPRASSVFLRPVNGPVISDFGPTNDGLHNDGINFRAPENAPVLASENGVVAYVGNALKGAGNLVLLRHDGGWMTAYGHLNEFRVERGQTVQRGQVIGLVGATGFVDSPQLHYELRKGTQAVDPQEYLGL